MKRDPLFFPLEELFPGSSFVTTWEIAGFARPTAKKGKNGIYRQTIDKTKNLLDKENGEAGGTKTRKGGKVATREGHRSGDVVVRFVVVYIILHI